MKTEPAIRLPSGVRDFLPRATARRRAIAERLLAEFELCGYQRLITPLFECADVLERGLGEDARAAAIRFVEPASGEVVALRPDITPQIARIAATRFGDIDGPIRLCYEGAVTRLSGGPRGQREILQAGVELIDADSPDGDAEAIAVAAAALGTIGIDEVRLDVGHVAIARWALGSVDDPDLRSELRALLAIKDRAAVARVAARSGVSRDARAVLEALPTLFGAPDQVIARARVLRLPAAGRKALDTLQAVLDMTREIVQSELHSSITVDLGEVRGFEYYTGIRFAGYAVGVGDAVLRGGRYDELIGRYGRAARATGFAVDIEAIAHAQSASQIDPPATPEAVLVCSPLSRRHDAARVASALRSRGHRAAVDLGGSRKPAALVRYAHSVGFSRVLVLGRSGARTFTASAAQPGDRRGTAVPVSAVRRAAAGRPGTLIAALGLGDARIARRA